MIAALQRHSVLRWAVGVLVAAVILTAVGAYLTWRHGFDILADRLAADAVVVAGGTFLLAVIAGGLALFALAESVERPRLTAWFCIDEQTQNTDAPQRTIEARLATPTDGPGGHQSTSRWNWRLIPETVMLQIVLRNSGDATAQYVNVTVEITGMQSYAPPAQGWMLIDIDYVQGLHPPAMGRRSGPHSPSSSSRASVAGLPALDCIPSPEGEPAHRGVRRRRRRAAVE